METSQTHIRFEPPTLSVVENAQKTPILNLQPLSVAWDHRRDQFAWKSLADGSLTVDLPFGKCHLQVREEKEPEALGLRVELVLKIERSVRLHALDTIYLAEFGRWEHGWTPHLRPKPDLVIADQVFRSPAVVMHKDNLAVALVPDLSTIGKSTKTYLDARRDGPGGKSLLAHGVGAWRPRGHVFFQRTKASEKTPAGAEIVLAHFLLIWPSAAGLPLESVARFLWARFAHPDSIAPQELLFARYDKLAIERIFAPDLFRRFTYQEKRVAAFITQTVTSRRKPAVLNARGTVKYLAQQKYVMGVMHVIQSHVFTRRWGNKLLTKALHSGRFEIPPMAAFAAWFNQVRTALGVAGFARRTGDAALLEKANDIVELALSAPMEHGCFWTLCFFPEDGEVFWRRGTRAFEVVDEYHLPDAAITGFHLLEWHELERPDQRILDRCRSLARFLVVRQDPSGAFPAWVKPVGDKLEVVPDLARSASTAAPAMFLARLQRVAPSDEWLAAATKAVQFIEREVLPAEKWFDFELFYSCAGRPTGADGPDPYTGCYPANTLSMYWAASACLDLYFATESVNFLRLARQCFARLSLFQQVWDTPRLSINTFGGFGVMNADAEFNDARQGLFVPLYFDMYRATREPEYFERGVAALRACYTTMLCAENATVAPGNMVHYRESDRGSVLENYGHQGWDTVTAGYLSPDWGCATALYATGHAFRRFGRFYVDVPHMRAFGIDRCNARFLSLDRGILHLEVQAPERQELDGVLEDPDSIVKEVLVNGRPASAVPGNAQRFRLKLDG